MGGEEMQDWLTAFATTAIAFVAGVQIVREHNAEQRTRREFARTRAVNFMIDQVLSDKISTMMSETRKLSRRGNGAAVRLDDFVSGAGAEERFVNADGYSVVLEILNFYEAMAISVKKGAIDANIMREWWGDSAVFHWRLFGDFINDFRKRRSTPNAFVEFERLARRWSPSDQRLIAQLSVFNPFRNSRRASAKTVAIGAHGRARAA